MEIKEVLVDGAEYQLEVSVLLEPLLSEGEAVTEGLRKIATCLEAVYEEESRSVVGGHIVVVSQLQEDQLGYLVSHGFRVMDFAAMFGCSTHTIQRRMSGFGMDSNRSHEISEAHLDERVGEIVAHLPYCGIRSIQGNLRADGIVMQRERVRQSLHCLDPLGVQMRLRA